jgi:hypothetical protein
MRIVGKTWKDKDRWKRKTDKRVKVFGFEKPLKRVSLSELRGEPVKENR